MSLIRLVLIQRTRDETRLREILALVRSHTHHTTTLAAPRQVRRRPARTASRQWTERGRSTATDRQRRVPRKATRQPRLTCPFLLQASRATRGAVAQKEKRRARINEEGGANLPQAELHDAFD